MKIVARFRESAKIPANIDRKAVLARLAELAATPGGLTVAKVKRERTTKGSPLRAWFASEEHAADSWWTKQASDLVGMVVTTIVDEEGKRTTARRWMSSHLEVTRNDPEDGQGRTTYVPIERVMSDAELRAEQRVIAMRELRVWAERWAWMRKDLPQIFFVIDRVEGNRSHRDSRSRRSRQGTKRVKVKRASA